MPPEMKTHINFTASEHPDYIAHAKLVFPDGKFSNFTVSRDMAVMLVAELGHHLVRHKEKMKNVPLPRPKT
jgi:hypothetical protein